MKHVVDLPRGWQGQLIRYRGYFFDDFERTVPFGKELRFLMGKFEIDGFQPDLLPFLVLGDGCSAFLCYFVQSCSCLGMFFCH